MSALRLRRFVPRYSLRTLALFLLFVTSGVALWRHWEAWWRVNEIPIVGLPPTPIPYAVAISPDCLRLAVVDHYGATGIWSAETGRVLHRLHWNHGDDENQGYTTSFVVGGGRELVRIVGPLIDVSPAMSPPSEMWVVEWDTGTRKLVREEWVARDELQAREAVVARLTVPDGRTCSIYGPPYPNPSHPRSDEPLGLWHAASQLSGSGRFSPDGRRIVTYDVGASWEATVWDVRTSDRLAELGGGEGAITAARFSPDGRSLLTFCGYGKLVSYRRRRPEWWWGVFWLWEFWLTAAFAGLLVSSILRDRKAFRAAPAAA